MIRMICSVATGEYYKDDAARRNCFREILKGSVIYLTMQRIFSRSWGPPPHHPEKTSTLLYPRFPRSLLYSGCRHAERDSGDSRMNIQERLTSSETETRSGNPSNMDLPPPSMYVLAAFTSIWEKLRRGVIEMGQFGSITFSYPWSAQGLP